MDDDHHVAEHSAYTAVALRSHKIMPALLGAGALFAAWKLARRPGPAPRLLMRKEQPCQSNSRN
jgi:hypothetical protein